MDSRSSSPVSYTHLDVYKRQTCTREQIVTFLYRFKNNPAVYGSLNFSDVNKTEQDVYKRQFQYRRVTESGAQSPKSSVTV